jgi:hypothetical protein
MISPCCLYVFASSLFFHFLCGLCSIKGTCMISSYQNLLCTCADACTHTHTHTHTSNHLPLTLKKDNINWD